MATTVTIYRLCVDGDTENGQSTHKCTDKTYLSLRHCTGIVGQDVTALITSSRQRDREIDLSILPMSPDDQTDTDPERHRHRPQADPAL